MKLIMMSLLLTVSCVGHTEIYSCEENGRKIFSQQPCGKDAKTVTLQNDARRIVIDPNDLPQTAADLCDLAHGAWDVALSSGRINKKQDQVPLRRIESYMRDRISNMAELNQLGVDMNQFIRPVAQVMQKLVELDPNPSSDVLNRFKDKCTENMINAFEKNKKSYRRSSYQNM